MPKKSRRCIPRWWVIVAFALAGIVGRFFWTFEENPEVGRLSPPRKPTAPPTLASLKRSELAASVKDQIVPRPLRQGDRCFNRAVSKSSWRQVSVSDMDLMNSYGDKNGAYSCIRQHGAVRFMLDLDKAQKVGGHAYELPFPDYIVGDEAGGWRSQRSTLQLFAVPEQSGPVRGPQPMGPAHASHDKVASVGNGAYSHWRHAITVGPYVSTLIRFSTPGNVPLNQLQHIIAVVHIMAPPMGWIEFTPGQTRAHQELFREFFFLTFQTVGLEPHVVDRPQKVHKGTHYLWRVGGGHEFELPLKPGELYEKRLPYQIFEHFHKYEAKGGILYPPPKSYEIYQNKVGLARLFKQAGVKTPETWVFETLQEALDAQQQVSFPVVIKDPYGFSSLGLQQAKDWPEFVEAMKRYFQDALPGVEAIVQKKVVALREARVTYIDGRPFHGYWRVRESIKSASAASNMGGYQDFSFPLADIAPYVAEFAKMTDVPVGGVDFIWQEEHPDVKQTPFTLEVSPTSDINPPAPATFVGTYSDFKKNPDYRKMFLAVRRKWAEQMVLAVIDRYRRSKRHLFVDIDNVVALSMARVRRWGGKAKAYSAEEVMRDEVVPDAVAALQELRESYFIRFLTARGQYEDCFNVTQTWLTLKGFQYDELLVVANAESKVAHMSQDSLLVDDFTVGHENEVPSRNEKFMEQLKKARLPFVVFPLGGTWAEVMGELREEAKRPIAA